jgi:hypothetical protein
MPTSPMSPNSGGAGDGSLTKLNTTPTAKPVPNAKTMAAIEGKVSVFIVASEIIAFTTCR